MNRRDLQAWTKVGPTREILVLDPQAVQHLNKQLHINYFKFEDVLWKNAPPKKPWLHKFINHREKLKY